MSERCPARKRAQFQTYRMPNKRASIKICSVYLPSQSTHGSTRALHFNHESISLRRGKVRYADMGTL